MEITKERALELLDSWLKQSYSFPKKELAIKTFSMPTLEKDSTIEAYAFTHLLCVAYDLEPKQKL
jgi:hypothetical protein